MLVSAAALALRSMAKSSGPLSALERAQGEYDERHEKRDDLAVGDARHEESDGDSRRGEKDQAEVTREDRSAVQRSQVPHLEHEQRIHERRRQEHQHEPERAEELAEDHLAFAARN